MRKVLIIIKKDGKFPGYSFKKENKNNSPY